MIVFVNDTIFHEMGNERDPIFGTQDCTFDMTIPKRPIRKKIKGLPAFTTIRAGAYFFLPGIRALRYLASLRSEEHTSELQSLRHLVCRLLLEKKKCGSDTPKIDAQSH